jgi:hypothetical protein
MQLENIKIFNLLAIILVCGIIGGIGNTLRENGVETKIYLKNIVLGIIASLTVPLFLQLVSSAIITEIISSDKNHLSNYLVFAGFCVIASFSAISFLTSISGRVLQNMKEDIKNLKSENETIKTNTERIDNNLNAIAINEGSKNIDQSDFDKIVTPETIQIMNSIQNAGKNFRPLEVIKEEINLDNKEIEKKVNILVEKHLIKELTLNDGSKAVALSEGAEDILNNNKGQQ